MLVRSEDTGTASATRLRLERLAWPLAITLVAALAMGVSVLMSWQRAPVPTLHDEFGHLLVADTLMHGRLANPPPAIWQPFQNFHILVRPSYASKYPLGPGALLALGKWCSGSPVAGIWLGAALCAAAVTWAAAGCLPRRWALVAGLLLALHPGVHHAWSLNYMNGWLAATASALVAGSVLRLRKRTRMIDCIVLGIGIGGLALTRPFEGLLFVLTASALLLYWWRGLAWPHQLARIGRIAALGAWPVIAALGVIALHNRATTGNFAHMAYQLHEARYGVAPLNIFQNVKRPEMEQWSADVPPSFIEFHYGWSLRSYAERAHLWGWWRGAAQHTYVVIELWGYGLCLVAALSIVRRGKALWPLMAAIAFALAVGTCVPWYFTHYFAPSLVWLVLLTVAGWRGVISRFASDRASLRWATLALLTVQVTFLAVEVRAANTRLETWADRRQRLSEQLERCGQQHLILVRYHPRHNVHHEWAFNGADLEQSPVLWARSWRPDLDEQLARHYQGQRHIWVLEVDQHDQPLLSPYRAEMLPKLGSL